MIDAIHRFDPVRNVKFETYAIPRIRGAIIDELRAIDWVPRSVRAKARALEQAYATLEATLLRTPTDAEVATELDISVKELQVVLRQLSFVGVAALDEVFPGRGARGQYTTLGDTVPDVGPGPAAYFDEKESKEILAQAIMHLGDRERTVLSLYYYEGLTLAEIGEVLGVTESRVCQIHTKAVLQLRAKLSDRTPEQTGARRGRRQLPEASDPASRRRVGSFDLAGWSCLSAGVTLTSRAPRRVHGRPIAQRLGKINRWEDHRGRRNNTAVAGGRDAFRPPDASVEPEDAALHLGRAQRDLHNRSPKDP